MGSILQQLFMLARHCYTSLAPCMIHVCMYVYMCMCMCLCPDSVPEFHGTSPATGLFLSPHNPLPSLAERGGRRHILQLRVPILRGRVQDLATAGRETGRKLVCLLGGRGVSVPARHGSGYPHDSVYVSTPGLSVLTVCWL